MRERFFLSFICLCRKAAHRQAYVMYSKRFSFHGRGLKHTARGLVISAADIHLFLFVKM